LDRGGRLRIPGVDFRKQLIQRDFLKRRHAQNLQKSVEGHLHCHFLFDDRDEHINAHRDPDLGPDGVLRCSIERLDPQVLFNPTEEQFDLPAELIEEGDASSRQVKVVRQEGQVSIVLLVKAADSAKMFGVSILRSDAGQDDGLIADHSLRFIEGMRIETAGLEVRHGPNDEESTSLMEGQETREVHIASVQDVEGPGLGKQLVKRSHIVRFSICHMDKRRDRSAQVEQGVELDGSLPVMEKSPGKERQAKLDRRRIEGVNGVQKFDSKVFVPIESAGLVDEDEGKVGVDPPVAGLVGVSQVVAGDRASDAHVVKAAPHGPQARDDIAKTLPIGQLGESQGQELIETGKRLNPVISVVSTNALPELVQGKEGHDLREDGRRSVHRSLLEEQKSADYIKSRSNRLRSLNSLIYPLCA